MKRFGKFLSRQLGTKTGKLGLALVVGTVANSVFNNPDTANMALQFANQIFTPESGTLGLAAMFLRDPRAKEKQEEEEGK